MNLVRRLYDLGYNGEQIRQLFRFIESMVTLPEDLQYEFKKELKRYEGGRRMPFLTSFEQDGITIGSLKTARESVIEVLEIRFSNVSAELKDRINSLDDLQWLKHLHKQSITSPLLEEFQQLLAQKPIES